MNIGRYCNTRAREIADLYFESVHAIPESVYTKEQKLAWAPFPINYKNWAERLSTKKPFIAIINNKVAGFIELDEDGHIDCTYTHPEFQRLGVASALYQHLLSEAKNRCLNRLYVEASFIAKPFFEKRGFSIIKKNEIQRNGVVLVNFSMEKQLA